MGECRWIDASLVERLLGGALDMDAILASQFQFADAATRTRMVPEHGGPWGSLVRFDGRFHGWINRSVERWSRLHVAGSETTLG